MNHPNNYSYVPYQVMDTDGVSLRAVLMRYARNWYWFVLSVGCLVLLAFLFLRYQHPTYNSRASLLVKDEKKGLDSDSMLKELEIFAPKKVVENEIEILKSYTLMERVVQQLHLDVQYFRDTPVGRREVFELAPIRLIVEKANADLYREEPIEIKFVNPTTVDIDGQQMPVNTSVETKFGRLRVFPRRLLSANTEPLFIQAIPVAKVTNDYLRLLKAEPTSKASTVIMISLETGVGDKGEAILNRLVDVYNEAAVMDKNRVASNTMRFIEDRLKLVARELESVEKNVEVYKSTQGITDLSMQAQGFLETVQKNDAELNEVTVALGTLNELQSYVNQQVGTTRVATPATVGLNDPTLIKLIQEATVLETQRAELLQTMPAENPMVKAVDSQLKLVKNNMSDNVRTMKNMLSSAKRQYVQTNHKIESTIRRLPVKERALMDITRQQAIKNDLYTYLLKKREETAVSYASVISDSRVVDMARSDPKPVKPNRQLTFLLFGFLGLLLPVVALAARDAVNNRVVRRSEVEESTSAPILGEIVRKKQPGSLVVSSRTNSVIAEQIRSLRTNLTFLRENREGSQVLLFTSSINGEGKSFLSLNLGASLALAGSRTVILEMDLRKPQLRNSLNIGNSTGLSNYLIGEATVDEIIRPVDDAENYFIIASGALPPNPSELLSNFRLETLIHELRERFDYVIIDAPPIGLVTDAQLIAPFVDATLYLVRHDVTPKHYLKMVDMLYREKRFNKLNIVLNDVSHGETNYYSYQTEGYGYAYGGEPKKKPFFHRFLPNAPSANN